MEGGCGAYIGAVAPPQGGNFNVCSKEFRQPGPNVTPNSRWWTESEADILTTFIRHDIASDHGRHRRV